MGKQQPWCPYDDKTLSCPSAHYRAASIIFQTVMFSLTVYKFAGALRSGWGHIPLVKLLIRDGTWAFILLFGMHPIPVFWSFLLSLTMH